MEEKKQTPEENNEPKEMVVSTDIADGTMALAQRMTAMHASVVQKYPKNYVHKMQPYFNVIYTHMRKNEIENPIEAVLDITGEKTKESDLIWFYATAAEMLNNMSEVTATGLVIPEEKKIQPLKIVNKDGKPY